MSEMCSSIHLQISLCSLIMQHLLMNKLWLCILCTEWLFLLPPRKSRLNISWLLNYSLHHQMTKRVKSCKCNIFEEQDQLICKNKDRKFQSYHNLLCSVRIDLWWAFLLKCYKAIWLKYSYSISSYKVIFGWFFCFLLNFYSQFTNQCPGLALVLFSVLHSLFSCARRDHCRDIAHYTV